MSTKMLALRVCTFLEDEISNPEHSYQKRPQLDKNGFIGQLNS